MYVAGPNCESEDIHSFPSHTKTGKLSYWWSWWVHVDYLGNVISSISLAALTKMWRQDSEKLGQLSGLWTDCGRYSTAMWMQSLYFTHLPSPGLLQKGRHRHEVVNLFNECFALIVNIHHYASATVEKRKRGSKIQRFWTCRRLYLSPVWSLRFSLLAAC